MQRLERLKQQARQAAAHPGSANGGGGGSNGGGRGEGEGEGGDFEAAQVQAAVREIAEPDAAVPAIRLPKKRKVGAGVWVGSWVGGWGDVLGAGCCCARHPAAQKAQGGCQWVWGRVGHSAGARQPTSQLARGGGGLGGLGPRLLVGGPPSTKLPLRPPHPSGPAEELVAVFCSPHTSSPAAAVTARWCNCRSPCCCPRSVVLNQNTLPPRCCCDLPAVQVADTIAALERQSGSEGSESEGEELLDWRAKSSAF